MTALDARAIANPFVGRFNHLLEIEIRENFLGKMRARSGDARIDQDSCASKA
jgi:hypothetical protein